jgi:hypothetical protein
MQNCGRVAARHNGRLVDAVRNALASMPMDFVKIQLA